MTYPRAWIAQDWAEWDGTGEPPEPFDGSGPLPQLGPARAHIDTGEAAIDNCEWPTVDAAIAWARSRVDIVLVRVGFSDYYSAGKEHPPNVARWPPSDEAIRRETLRRRS